MGLGWVVHPKPVLFPLLTPPYMIRRTNSRNNVGNNDFDAMINYEFNFDEHLSYNLLRTYGWGERGIASVNFEVFLYEC